MVLQTISRLRGGIDIQSDLRLYRSDNDPAGADPIAGDQEVWTMAVLAVHMVFSYKPSI